MKNNTYTLTLKKNAKSNVHQVLDADGNVIGKRKSTSGREYHFAVVTFQTVERKVANIRALAADYRRDAELRREDLKFSGGNAEGALIRYARRYVANQRASKYGKTPVSYVVQIEKKNATNYGDKPANAETFRAYIDDTIEKYERLAAEADANADAYESGEKQLTEKEKTPGVYAWASRLDLAEKRAAELRNGFVTIAKMAPAEQTDEEALDAAIEEAADGLIEEEVAEAAPAETPATNIENEIVAIEAMIENAREQKAESLKAAADAAGNGNLEGAECFIADARKHDTEITRLGAMIGGLKTAMRLIA